MEVPPLSQATFAGAASAGQQETSQAGNSRIAFEAARKLNNLEITDREFSVVRDPISHRFVVVVLDQQTGTVLDQFPPEDILKMLAQLAPYSKSNAGGAANEDGGTQA